MICIHCGLICDYQDSGICQKCQMLLESLDLRVHMLDLLNQAQEFCPVKLREKIEFVMQHQSGRLK